jgi:hypothetical protein
MKFKNVFGLNFDGGRPGSYDSGAYFVKQDALHACCSRTQIFKRHHDLNGVPGGDSDPSQGFGHQGRGYSIVSFRKRDIEDVARRPARRAYIPPPFLRKAGKMTPERVKFLAPEKRDPTYIIH